MKSAIVNGMRLGRFLAVVVFCVLPTGASAQPWADAYRARDYEKQPTSAPGSHLHTRAGFRIVAPGIPSARAHVRGRPWCREGPFAACMLANWADAATKKLRRNFSAQMLAPTRQVSGKANRLSPRIAIR